MKKLFAHIIKLLIVVVLIFSVSAVATSCNTVSKKDAKYATIALLKHLALAEESHIVDTGRYADTVDELALHDSNFHPHPEVAFSIALFDNDEEAGYIFFAAYAIKGSQVYMYNKFSGRGVTLYVGPGDHSPTDKTMFTYKEVEGAVEGAAFTKSSEVIITDDPNNPGQMIVSAVITSD